MIDRRSVTAVLTLSLASVLTASPGTTPAPAHEEALRPVRQSTLTTDLDRIFADAVLARATMAVRVESLQSGRVLYQRQSGTHVIPASNMKLVTLAVMAARLGWDYQFETRLEAEGEIVDGTLHGDLVVVGGGDPSIGSQDGDGALVFLEWAAALRAAGIRRVAGRLVGDDDAFDDESLGAGWAWDNLPAGYSAPSGALSYNENVVVVRVVPGTAEGTPAEVRLTPPGADVELLGGVTTGAPRTAATIGISRELGSDRLVVTGRVPAGGDSVIRIAAVLNPTRFFVQGLHVALAARGISVAGGAWDLDDVDIPLETGRRVLATRRSLPLSALAGRFMKDSQNFYGEMFLKTIGLATAGVGTAENGRRGVRDVLATWGVGDDEVVMYDGSGLSRYNYVTADAIIGILKQVWRDERLRGPFLASLPVGGVDGTLASRMNTPALRGRVQAKTGTINNVRALSGYLTTADGEKLVFSMIANHFTATSAEIDAVAERALEVLAGR